LNKIETIFDRGEDFKVIDKIRDGCEWVFNGEGKATEKVDGQNVKVLFKDGKIIHVWKRRNPNKEEKKLGIEPGYIDADQNDPQDKHIFRSVNNCKTILPDGEYPCEAFGGKIQGNPLEVEPNLYFFTMDPKVYENVPRNFEGLKVCLKYLVSHFNPGKLAEGIVFHNPDGKMAKIKRRDFDYELPRAKA
jgi:hypothetical protein